MSGSFINVETDFINWRPTSDYLSRGPQGFQGFQGLVGSAGAPGGPTGLPGAQGAQGNQGYQGPPTGNPGPQGIVGVQGNAGLDGITVINSTGLPNTNLGVCCSLSGTVANLIVKTPAFTYNPSVNLLRNNSQILCFRNQVSVGGSSRTLSATNLQSGIITNTANNPMAYTLDTGANITALYGASNLVINDSWFIFFCNLNNVEITMTASSGTTVVGGPQTSSFMGVLQYNGSSAWTFYM